MVCFNTPFHSRPHPPSVVVSKAQQLCEDYIVACVRHGIDPQTPVVNGQWVRRWRLDRGVSFRKPNRKWKVPKEVLKERCQIFWSNVFRVRGLIRAKFGYDPALWNFDQSPYHMNEAGSKETGTLALRGQPVVVLKEGHAATRSRWTMNTMCISDFDDANTHGGGGIQGDEAAPTVVGMLPPLELMFKAQGCQLEHRLQASIPADASWMSVTTSPKGSYREEHVLAYLERHLEPWSADRRWRILITDAFSAHMGDNIRRLAWHRGYIVILHGGGTTGVMQVNDTDLHQHLRRLYVEEEQIFLIARNRAAPGQLVTPRPSDCIQWAATIWRRRSLHIRGSGGFKSVGAAVALDGSEDHLVTREAKQVWDDVNMKSAREEALSDVTTEFRAGRLQWTYNHVYELVCDYPKRGALDRLEELQDDEDPVDGVPWCEGDALEEDCVVGASDSDAAHEEGDAPAVAGDGEGLEDAAPAKAASPSGDAAVSTSAVAELPLEVADAAEDHHRRKAALLRLKALADQAQSPHVTLSIERALHMETRRVRLLSGTDSAERGSTR